MGSERDHRINKKRFCIYHGEKRDRFFDPAQVGVIQQSIYNLLGSENAMT